MKILINPRFRQKLEKKKKLLKSFEVVELEKFLVEIEENPPKGDRIGNSDFYKKSIISTYFVCIVVYEYNSKSDKLIFWSIE